MAKNSPFAKSLGLTLKALREFSGLAREDLSKKTGISVSAIESIEKGRKPTARQMNILFKAFGWKMIPYSPEDSCIEDDGRKIRSAWSMYTDGSSYMNPRKGAYAYVILRDGNEYARGSGFVPDASNNEMELTAVLAGLRKAREEQIDVLDVYTDSQYVINSIIPQKHPAYASSNRNDTRAEHAAETMEEVRSLIHEFEECSFHWIPGHSGNKWNEVCDSICTAEYTSRNLPRQEYYNKTSF